MGTRGDDQHRYGQHYTPIAVARLLAALAIGERSDRVLDPSCGDGRLLLESFKLRDRPAKRDAARLFGLDRSASAVEAASRLGFQVACADFFDVEPGSEVNRTLKLPDEFDALIGNPPYIRHELMGAMDKRRVEACLERDRAACPDLFWPKWSRRSDIYVYFFAHSARFLRSGGRLVFLTAGSWLDVGYGAALREFLVRNFRIIAIIESSVESFFADASINTAITVLERVASRDRAADNLVSFVRLSRPLGEILDERRGSAECFAESILTARATGDCVTHRTRLVRQGDLSADEDPRVPSFGWGRYLRAEDVFYRVLMKGGSRLIQLGAMAKVRFGVKTGANEFFYVDRGRENEANAPETRRNPKNGSRSTLRGSTPVGSIRRLDEVASVRRGLTTGANAFFYLRPTTDAGESVADERNPGSHQTVTDSTGALRSIEAKHLSPVVFSLKELPGILLDKIPTTRLLFNCAATKAQLKGSRALEYIEAGERAGYHLRPTCSSRQQWYSVAREMKPAALIFPSKVGERWVVAINRARVFEDKKLYGIFPHARVSTMVLAALLNSTWARYYAEITCRQMTGAQAIADIDVAVAEAVLLPDPRYLSPAIRKELEAALRVLARRRVLSVFEEVKCADRRRLDELVLSAMGFRGRERNEVLEELYATVVQLVRERLTKAARNAVKL